MPSSIFSHQAPGLILKVKFPKRLDGTALCLGTLIPDFYFTFDFFLPNSFYRLTHSLVGQILWTIPLAILATLIFSRFVGPFCADIASYNVIMFKPLRYFGIDQWKFLKNKKFDKRFWITAAYSALIGGVTHVLLDWPSHADVYALYPWIVSQSPDFLMYSIVNYGTISIGPFLFEANLTIYNLLWFVETIVTFVISLYYLRYIKKHNLIRKWYEELR